MEFESPFAMLVYGWTFGVTFAVVIHYVVWPLKAGRWFKMWGGK